jgi:hypothetical protein
MSDEPAPLVPVDERLVDFYGDPIVVPVAPLDERVIIYVPLRLLCDHMSISWSGQRERVNRDPVLSKAVRGVRVTRTPGAGGGTQVMLCIPLEYLPGWLFGINTNRVKNEEHRNKIIRYQEECFRVLWEAFGHRMVVQPETAIEPAEEGANIQELQRIAEMGEAIAHMARQQIEFQQQQEQLTRRLNKAGQIVKSIQGDVADVQEDVADIQIRLGTVEDKLHPHAYITDEQAAEVSTVVKALAEMLTRQEKGKNHYQGIFGELHRRFGAASYKHIRQEQYDAVLSFLDDWRNAAVAGQEFPTD